MCCVHLLPLLVRTTRHVSTPHAHQCVPNLLPRAQRQSLCASSQATILVCLKRWGLVGLCPHVILHVGVPSAQYLTPAQGSLVRENSWLFDLDDQWATEPHFVRYDYNAPEQLPAALHGTFDCVVIDPPFITREVWEKYVQAAKLLLQPGGEAGDVGPFLVDSGMRCRRQICAHASHAVDTVLL